jgi:hypothetical protein
MTNTGYARTSAFPQPYRTNLPERHAASTDWVTLEVFTVTPPTDQPWHCAVYCTADVDFATVGQLRFRSSASSVVSPAVNVTGFARNVRLGFQGIANTTQLIYLEGRRLDGPGGIRLLKAAPTILSAPPAGLITGAPPSTGTPAPTVAVLRGWQLSPHFQFSQTLSSSDFVNATGPVGLVTGDRVLLVAVASGPSEVASLAITGPGAPLFYVESDNFRPRIIGWEVEFETATTWTVVSTNSLIRCGAVAVGGAASFVAGAPTSATTPAVPGSRVNPADSVGFAFTALNFTGATVTAPPSGNTMMFYSGVGNRQLYGAYLNLPTAGTYAPGAVTVTGSEQATSIAVVAQPLASTSEPVIPAFNSATAITINPTDNAASIVAAQPAGTHFALTAGTYTNWQDVRPKAGMHFRGVGVTTILSGASKGYCFRASTDTSDDVTIGNMKIQNYGNGTTRQEFAAINPYPSDWLGGQFTYNHANNWFIYDVELATNSSSGISLSDNCTCLRVTAYGHTVTGIYGDRVVGGTIYDCLLEANALDPATGLASNGAQIKCTWVNGDIGRTSIVSLQRPKSQLKIVNSTFNATRSGISGSCAIGVWFDLDCQNTWVEGNDFNNHGSVAVFWEGCNNGVAKGNNVTNSDGYGNALGENFINGGICTGESTNITVEGNTLTGCVRALVNRMSGRSDWTAPGDIADPSAARYWLNAAGPTPVPGPTAWSNIWTGNNVYRDNVLISCDRVIINEGTASATHNPVGSTPVNTIQFIDNDYSGSTNITNATSGGGFFDRSNTGLTLTQWRALPYTRDQP